MTFKKANERVFPDEKERLYPAVEVVSSAIKEFGLAFCNEICEDCIHRYECSARRVISCAIIKCKYYSQRTENYAVIRGN